MSEPNPHADDVHKWGPPPQPANPPTVADGQGYGYPAGGPPAYDPPSYDPPAYGYPQQAPGYGYPGYGYPGPGQQPTQGGNFPVPHQGYPGAPVLSIGDITVMSDAIVTPSGTMPLRGAVWTATDMSRTEEKIPPVAIVLAIVFALLCLVGLLFLLMKEKKTTGFVQVTVTSGGRHHSTMIPAMNPNTFPMVMAQVNTARSMSV